MQLRQHVLELRLVPGHRLFDERPQTVGTDRVPLCYRDAVFHWPVSRQGVRTSIALVVLDESGIGREFPDAAESGVAPG